MAITIDWSERIISIPRADMTLVQSVPVEIRDLDLNVFRLELKDIEDSADGIVNLDTHSHNTEVTLSGLTFARVVEIINGYTITFEDGQYAVNLVGANSNVADVINVNQVSVRSQNSAGLISTPLIEYSSFNGGVTIDVTSDNSGTLFPVGTPQAPVNNLDDAKIIAEYRGLSRLFIIGDITFSTGTNIDGFIVTGENAIKSSFVLETGISTVGCEFNEATIDGELSGNAFIRTCTVRDLTYIEGQLRECVLVGTILLAGNDTTNILDCWDGIAGDGKPVIDCGGSGQGLTIGGYNGEIMIINKNGSDKVSIDLVAGEVEIDSTVSNGEIFVRGVGTLIDNSTGTAVIDWAGLMSREVYNEYIYLDTSSSNSGINYPNGTLRYPVNNMTDAKAIADALGIRTISLVGSITLTESYAGYKFISPYLSSGLIDFNGQDVSGCIFEGIVVSGNGVGPFSAINCDLLNGMTGIQASLDECILAGTFFVATGQTLECNKCNLRGVANLFDLNGSGSLSIAGVSGVFQIQNITSPLSLAAVTGNFICTLDSTCQQGTVLISGIGQVNDNSTGSNVINKIVPSSVYTPSDVADAVWDEQASEHQTVGSFGAMMEKIKFWVNYLRTL